MTRNIKFTPVDGMKVVVNFDEFDSVYRAKEKLKEVQEVRGFLYLLDYMDGDFDMPYGVTIDKGVNDRETTTGILSCEWDSITPFED